MKNPILNILHLIPYFVRADKTGGPARQVRRLAFAEQALGNRVQIVSTTANLDEEIEMEFAGDVYETEERGLSTVYLRRKKNVLPATYYYASALSEWLKGNLTQFDIVIVHGTWTYFNWMCTRMCRKYGKPYLIFVHGSLDPWALNHHRWKKMLYWHLLESSNYRSASGIIVLSEDEKKQVQEKGVDKLVFGAKNGLLHPVLCIDNPNELIRQSLPDVSGHPYILFMSRLHVKKGLEVLLEAWQQVSHQYPEWRLVVAGPDEGGQLKKLQEIVDRSGLRGTVLFPGLVLGEVKTAFLQSASLFVLPSLSEGVPGAVVDALAYGLPVLITPACHLPEVVAARAGLVVDPEAQAVAKGLEHLMSNANLRQQMGQNAERLARDEFDEIKVASGLVAFCKSLLGQTTKIV